MRSLSTRAGRMWVPGLLLLLTASCATPQRAYLNRDMDFGSINSVAVMPFWNLSQDHIAGDRVRDVLSNALLATDAVYVLPPGEVARGIARMGIANPATPSTEEIVKLGGLLKVEAIITGVLKEYGEVRSASASANVVSFSVQMYETSSGKVIWSASSTKGGIGWGARLLGTSTGDPMNDLTERAVEDVISRLFK